MGGNYKLGRFRPLFLAANKGDSFTLSVSDWADNDANRFIARVQGMRTEYKKTHGIQTLMERAEDGRSVKITILSAAGDPSVRVVESAPGVDPNKKPKAEPAAHKLQASEPEPVYNDDARAFYRELYMSSMRMLPGATPEHCARDAETGARLYMERFG